VHRREVDQYVAVTGGKAGAATTTGVAATTSGSVGQTTCGTKLRSEKVHSNSSNSAVSAALAVRTAPEIPDRRLFRRGGTP